MKLNYFHYHLEPHSNPDTKLTFDLRPVIKAFSASKDKLLRSSFRYRDGEHVFLFWVGTDTYLFILTKSKEIIKAVSDGGISHDDVYSRLGKNEQLGFASYVYLGKRHFGIARTLHGPQHRIFQWFVDELLARGGFHGHSFIVFPFETSATRAEVMGMEFVGKSVIEIEPGHGFWEPFKKFVGLGNTTRIRSLKLIVTPERGSNLKEESTKLAAAFDDPGLAKYMVVAKENLADAISEYYITGAGKLSDMISSAIESDIVKAIQTAAGKNKALISALQEIEKDGQYQPIKADAIVCADLSHAWHRGRGHDGLLGDGQDGA